MTVSNGDIREVRVHGLEIADAVPCGRIQSLACKPAAGDRRKSYNVILLFFRLGVYWRQPHGATPAGHRTVNLRFCITILFLFAASIVVMACNNIPLNDYAAKSNEENQILSVLKQYQEAKNRSDIESFLSLLHEHGQYSFLDRLVAKRELKQMLPVAWKKLMDGKMPTDLITHEQVTGDYFGHWELYDPKISIDNKAANVTVFVKFNWWWGLTHHIQLIRDKKGWLINYLYWDTV